MDATLTDRYVLAVTRSIPEKQRDDVARELRASIADQLEARVDGGEAADAAERALLTELGDPEKLAAGFAERPLHLVGPRYYLHWKRLLALLLWIVPACAAFGIALGQALSGAPLGEIIGSAVTGVLGVIVHLCFWVTLVFVILERTGTTEGLEPWTLDDLPEPRESGATFAEMVASIIALVVTAGAIVWDQSIGFVPGMQLPFLNPDLWPWWFAGLFVIMALECVLAIVAHVRGRWTVPLAVAKAVLAAAFAVPAIWLLSQGLLLNPEFFPALLPAGTGTDVPQILTILAGFGIAAIAIWDVIDAVRKARRR